MNDVLSVVLERHIAAIHADTDVIPWASPVLSFGDPTKSSVATVGLNPSNREFVDENGRELSGKRRRFQTLKSLGIGAWAGLSSNQAELILTACIRYFGNNPYDGWFRRLDTVISGTDTSYYEPHSAACHLDLIPFATGRKWSELTRRQRQDLLSISGDALARILQKSSIRLLILNGRSVVERFMDIAGINVSAFEMSAWALPRRSVSVSGYAYCATIETLSGIPLGRRVALLGYNHNIQSSFGVTTETIAAIRNWIGWYSRGALA